MTDSFVYREATGIVNAPFARLPIQWLHPCGNSFSPVNFPGSPFFLVLSLLLVQEGGSEGECEVVDVCGGGDDEVVEEGGMGHGWCTHISIKSGSGAGVGWAGEIRKMREDFSIKWEKKGIKTKKKMSTHRSSCGLKNNTINSLSLLTFNTKLAMVEKTKQFAIITKRSFTKLQIKGTRRKV